MKPETVMVKLISLLGCMEEDSSRHRKNRAQRPFGKELEECRLSHSAREALVILRKHDSMNQRNLAQYLGVTPQAVSETVKKLLLHGCITKENGLQKNENFIALTPLGEGLADLLQEIVAEHAQACFAPFSQEELVLFDHLLEKLLVKTEEP